MQTFAKTLSGVLLAVLVAFVKKNWNWNRCGEEILKWENPSLKKCILLGLAKSVSEREEEVVCKLSFVSRANRYKVDINNLKVEI